MKLSEMTNDQATDALIRISGPFESICGDDEVSEALNEISGMGDEPFIRAIGRMVPMLTGLLFKKHKQDLYEIVSALTMKPVSQIGKMNFKETVNTIQESYDDILRDFFTRTALVRKISAKR